jgi:hypothetical protein
VEKKILFNEEYESFNEEGLALSIEFRKVIDPIFKKWIEYGYPIREIGHILLSEVSVSECEFLLERQIKIQKEKRRESSDDRPVN